MSTGLGKRVKKKRLELNLSQEQLAHKLGLKSKSTICKVEGGDDNLTSITVRKYADALETTPAYLMGWTESDSVETSDRLMAYAEKITDNYVLYSYIKKIEELPEEYRQLAFTSIDRIYEAYKATKGEV